MYISKRKTAMFLAIAVLLTLLLSPSISAQSEDTLSLSGNGTLTAPYLITSEEDWTALAAWVNNGNSGAGQYFELTDDLDFTDYTDKLHTSLIVGKSNDYVFSGTFNGNGNTISGLIISGNGSRYGVFGVISGATIYNLNVAHCNFTSAHSTPFVAGLVSYAKGTGNIANCHLKDVALTHNYDPTKTDGGGTFAGLVGYASAGLVVTDCSVDVSYKEKNSGTTKTPCFGGVLGAMAVDSTSHNLQISDCAVVADVEYTNVKEGITDGLDIGCAVMYVGGVVGSINSGGGTAHTFDNCYADLRLNASLADDIVTKSAIDTGNKFFGVGGIIGMSGQTRGQKTTLSNCYANLDATFTSNMIDGSWVGALVGGMKYVRGTSELTINNSYYTANTTGIKDDATIYAVGCQNGSASATEIGYVPGLYNGVNVWKDDTARAAIVAYGAAAKAYIAAPNETATALTAVDWTAYADNGANKADIYTDTDLTYVGSSIVILDTCVTLRHYFICTNAEVTAVTVDGAAVDLIEKDGYVYAEIDVAPADFATKLDVKNGENTVLRYSVYNYCARASKCGISTTAQNVIVALKNMENTMKKMTQTLTCINLNLLGSLAEDTMADGTRIPAAEIRYQYTPALLKAYDADIICVQEAKHTLGTENWYDILIQEMPAAGYGYVSYEGETKTQQILANGLIIFYKISRFEKLDSGAVNYASTDYTSQRGFIWAKLYDKAEQKTVFVTDTHWSTDLKYLGNDIYESDAEFGDAQRTGQAQDLLRFWQETVQDGILFACGDYNCTMNSKWMGLLEEGIYRDGLTVLGSAVGSQTKDHCFVNPNTTQILSYKYQKDVFQYENETCRYSDHSTVVIQVKY